MSVAGRQFPANRIVVALESSCENLKALEIAATLAARIKASLHGIFVEDRALLTAASLPFVRHVNVRSGLLDPLEVTDVETQFRALAGRARARLEDLASRMSVPWSFEVLRGEPAAVISATSETDLLVLETATRPFARHMQLRTNWPEIALDCARACLLVAAAVEGRTGILAVYDGTESGERAVAAAIALDGTSKAVLQIAAVGGAARADVPHALKVADMVAEVYPLHRLDADGLLRVIAEAKSGLVIVPAPLAASHRAALQPLLLAPPCPVLLVR